MALSDAFKWRPASNSTFFGVEHTHYLIGRGNSMESETKGPSYQLLEDCVVGAAIVNGKRTRDEIEDYANDWAGYDKAKLDVALDRIEGNIRLLRQHGWDVPDHQPGTTAPTP